MAVFRAQVISTIILLGLLDALIIQSEYILYNVYIQFISIYITIIFYLLYVIALF